MFWILTYELWLNIISFSLLKRFNLFRFRGSHAGRFGGRNSHPGHDKSHLGCQNKVTWRLLKVYQAWGCRFVSTLSRSKSRRSRKSWQFQKACLDDPEISILSRHHHPDPNILIEIFGSGWWCRDKIEISGLSRQAFWNCQDFLDRRD